MRKVPLCGTLEYPRRSRGYDTRRFQPKLCSGSKVCLGSKRHFRVGLILFWKEYRPMGSVIDTPHSPAIIASIHLQIVNSLVLASKPFQITGDLKYFLTTQFLRYPTGGVRESVKEIIAFCFFS